MFAARVTHIIENGYNYTSVHYRLLFSLTFSLHATTPNESDIFSLEIKAGSKLSSIETISILHMKVFLKQLKIILYVT